MNKVIKRIKNISKRIITRLKFSFFSKSTNNLIFISSNNIKYDNEILIFLKKIKENPIYFVPEIARNDARLRRYLFKYGVYKNNEEFKSIFVVQSNGVIAGPISINEEDHLVVCKILNSKFKSFKGKKNTGSIYSLMPNIDATLILRLNDDVVNNLHIRKGKGFRKDIKIARDNNIVVLFNDLSYLYEFSNLHKEHLGSKAYTYESIKTCLISLPSYYSFASALDASGKLLSGAIFIIYDSRAMFWLSATSDAGKIVYSQSLCLLETIRYCYSRGVTVFDFGGVGYPNLNSWDDFKKNFGSEYEIKYKK